MKITMYVETMVQYDMYQTATINIALSLRAFTEDGTSQHNRNIWTICSNVEDSLMRCEPEDVECTIKTLIVRKAVMVPINDVFIIIITYG